MNNPEVKKESKRKYAAVWEKLKAEGRCTLECSHQDTLTIINMVRKEKTIDKNKPKGKLLKQEITNTGITFMLVNDTSINNL